MKEEIPFNPPGLSEYIRDGARKNSAILRKMQGKATAPETAEAKPGSVQPDCCAALRELSEIIRRSKDRHLQTHGAEIKWLVELPMTDEEYNRLCEITGWRADGQHNNHSAQTR